ncbi:MAG: ATP-binding protein [Chloroflexi bacterium]|nr:ATP-binding protein [Chloroflexota bacterium]
MEGRSFADDLRTIFAALPKTDATTANPVLIVICGLPGVGKSFLAHALVERLPAVIVESDFVRKTLFPKPTYSGLESTWVHRIAHVVMERLLKSGRRVIYDATNLYEWHRAKSYQLADRANAKLIVVQIVAPEALIRERLTKRFESRDPGDLSDATWQVYEHLRRTAEPIRHPHLVVDTSRDLNPAIIKILRATK